MEGEQTLYEGSEIGDSHERTVNIDVAPDPTTFNDKPLEGPRPTRPQSRTVVRSRGRRAHSFEQFRNNAA